MRRYLPIMLLMLLLAAACGDSSDATVATTPPATDAPAGTQAAAEGTPADLAITEVVFGADGHATLTNLGTGTVSLDGLWLCNRPQYFALSGSVAAGESIEITAADFTVLLADGGDLGLYGSNEFGSADAIVDYVAWGTGGGRLSVAVAAGIWPDGDAVAASGTSIAAPTGGAGAADWS